MQVVRFTLNWNQIAPTRARRADRPEGRGVRLVKVDRVLDGLRTRGIDVVLQLNGAPSWANGGSRRTTRRRRDDVPRLRDRRGARYPWVKRG